MCTLTSRERRLDSRIHAVFVFPRRLRRGRRQHRRDVHRAQKHPERPDFPLRHLHLLQQRQRQDRLRAVRDQSHEHLSRPLSQRLDLALARLAFVRVQVLIRVHERRRVLPVPRLRRVPIFSRTLSLASRPTARSARSCLKTTRSRFRKTIPNSSGVETSLARPPSPSRTPPTRTPTPSDRTQSNTSSRALESSPPRSSARRSLVFSPPSPRSPAASRFETVSGSSRSTPTRSSSFPGAPFDAHSVAYCANASVLSRASYELRNDFASASARSARSSASSRVVARVVARVAPGAGALRPVVIAARASESRARRRGAPRATIVAPSEIAKTAKTRDTGDAWHSHAQSTQFKLVLQSPKSHPCARASTRVDRDTATLALDKINIRILDAYSKTRDRRQARDRDPLARHTPTRAEGCRARSLTRATARDRAIARADVPRPSRARACRRRAS